MFIANNFSMVGYIGTNSIAASHYVMPNVAVCYNITPFTIWTTYHACTQLEQDYGECVQREVDGECVQREVDRECVNWEVDAVLGQQEVVRWGVCRQGGCHQGAEGRDVNLGRRGGEESGR